MLGPARFGEAPPLQDEVVVGRRVHGVEDVCVVGDLQFCREHMFYFIITTFWQGGLFLPLSISI